VRLRGTIEALSDSKLTLRERSGQRTELALSPTYTVTEVFPIALTDIKPGSFVGVGAMPQPDGSQRAIAVLLFPENMRGTGEGHRPFDFLPQSTMTNATVADVAAIAERPAAGAEVQGRRQDHRRAARHPHLQHAPRGPQPAGGRCAGRAERAGDQRPARPSCA
jgi:hypothetical protein